jgi:hypothetical protein
MPSSRTAPADVPIAPAPLVVPDDRTPGFAPRLKLFRLEEDQLPSRDLRLLFRRESERPLLCRFASDLRSARCSDVPEDAGRYLVLSPHTEDGGPRSRVRPRIDEGLRSPFLDSILPRERRPGVRHRKPRGSGLGTKRGRRPRAPALARAPAQARARALARKGRGRFHASAAARGGRVARARLGRGSTRLLDSAEGRPPPPRAPPCGRRRSSAGPRGGCALAPRRERIARRVPH